MIEHRLREQTMTVNTKNAFVDRIATLFIGQRCLTILEMTDDSLLERFTQHDSLHIDNNQYENSDPQRQFALSLRGPSEAK